MTKRFYTISKAYQYSLGECFRQETFCYLSISQTNFYDAKRSNFLAEFLYVYFVLEGRRTQYNRLRYDE